jgi:tetratricopeptide (TPR) repeat protein
LAPVDQSGFADAHFWLAQQHLNGKTGLSPDEALKQAESHLNHLQRALEKAGLKSNQVLPAVTFVRAEVEIRKKQFENGMKLLESIATYWPAAIALMERHLGQSNPTQALKYGLVLYEEIKRQPKYLSAMSEHNFATWCTALASGGDRPELIDALNHWHRRFPDNEMIHDEIVSIRLLQIDTLLSRGSQSDSVRAAEILVKATLELPVSCHATVSQWATPRLVPKGTDPAFEKVVELAVAKDDASSMLLEIVGSAKAWENDYRQARELFQRAVEKNSENALAWNGLALMELQSDRLPQAMECANRAVEYGKQNVVYLRTRGLIALKLEKWDQVVSDLRQVVAAYPNSKPDHQYLARAYLATGNQAMYELHQSQAGDR